jgi:hypothetical protein
MLNYKRIHYEEYYIMNEDGSSYQTDRKTCFASAEPVTEDNPYKQRWFYSPDHKLAIRLPRNELGEQLGKNNAAELKAEERIRDNTAKFLTSLDKPIDINTDGTPVYMEIEDENANIERDYIAHEKLNAIYAVIDTLSPADQELWRCLLYKVKKEEVAKRLGITVDGVTYRQNRLYRILLANPSLKNILKKS